MSKVYNINIKDCKSDLEILLAGMSHKLWRWLYDKSLDLSSGDMDSLMDNIKTDEYLIKFEVRNTALVNLKHYLRGLLKSLTTEYEDIDTELERIFNSIYRGIRLFNNIEQPIYKKIILNYMLDYVALAIGVSMSITRTDSDISQITRALSNKLVNIRVARKSYKGRFKQDDTAIKELEDNIRKYNNKLTVLNIPFELKCKHYQVYGEDGFTSFTNNSDAIYKLYVSNTAQAIDTGIKIELSKKLGYVIDISDKVPIRIVNDKDGYPDIRFINQHSYKVFSLADMITTDDLAIKNTGSDMQIAYAIIVCTCTKFIPGKELCTNMRKLLSELFRYDSTEYIRDTLEHSAELVRFLSNCACVKNLNEMYINGLQLKDLWSDYLLLNAF